VMPVIGGMVMRVKANIVNDITVAAEALDRNASGSHSLPSSYSSDRRVPMHPMPPGEAGGSKRKDAPNERPFSETLGFLRRRGAASNSDWSKTDRWAKGSCHDLRNGSKPDGRNPATGCGAKAEPARSDSERPDAP